MILGQWFSSSIMHQNPLQIFFKHRLQGHIFRVVVSVGLGRNMRICIPKKFPGDAYATVSAITLGNPLFQDSLKSMSPLFSPPYLLFLLSNAISLHFIYLLIGSLIIYSFIY